SRTSSPPSTPTSASATPTRRCATSTSSPGTPPASAGCRPCWPRRGPWPSPPRSSCATASSGTRCAPSSRPRAPPPASPALALLRLGAGDDLHQLLGDHRLAGAVVQERQPADHVRGVVGG